MLYREHPSRAPETALDLIGNEQDAVAVAEGAKFAKKFEGRHVEAAFSLHGFDDHGGDTVRGDRRMKQLVDRAKRVADPHTPKFVGKRNVIDIRRKRTETGLVWIDLSGQGQRHHRAPVKSTPKREHRRTSGRVAGNLDGILDRLGAGSQEDGLFRLVPRRK